MDPVSIYVPGEPVPWQRARRRGNRYFPAPAVEEYQDRIGSAWLVAGRPTFASSALIVSARFVCGRKPSHLTADDSVKDTAPVYPPRADVDNFLKGCLDGLQGLAYDNDAQVVGIEELWKRYVIGPGEEPHTELELQVLDVSNFPFSRPRERAASKSILFPDP